MFNLTVVGLRPTEAAELAWSQRKWCPGDTTRATAVCARRRSGATLVAGARVRPALIKYHPLRLLANKARPFRIRQRARALVDSAV